MNKRDLTEDKGIFAAFCGGPDKTKWSDREMQRYMQWSMRLIPEAIDRAIAAEQRATTLEGLLREWQTSLHLTCETCNVADGGFMPHCNRKMCGEQTRYKMIEQALKGGDGDE